MGCGHWSAKPSRPDLALCTAAPTPATHGPEQTAVVLHGDIITGRQLTVGKGSQGYASCQLFHCPGLGSWCQGASVRGEEGDMERGAKERRGSAERTVKGKQEKEGERSRAAVWEGRGKGHVPVGASLSKLAKAVHLEGSPREEPQHPSSRSCKPGHPLDPREGLLLQSSWKARRLLQGQPGTEEQQLCFLGLSRGPEGPQ